MLIRDRFKYGVWNVGIIRKNIGQILNEPDNIEINWMKHKYKDRFFADPFLLEEDKEFLYILAEEYIFFKGKGTIVKLIVNKKDMTLFKKELFLETKHHLSFPGIFQQYILPEQYRSNATYLYNLQSKKEYKICDIGLIDPIIVNYKDKNYIFATRKVNSDEEAKSDLYIYQYINGKLLETHSNPIKSDIRTARPAGDFFEVNGKLYRPVQDSTSRYGECVHIMQVEILDDKTYVEKEICCISSAGSPPYDLGLHTFNVYADYVIVDGYTEVRKYFWKIIWTLKLKYYMKK